MHVCPELVSACRIFSGDSMFGRAFVQRTNINEVDDGLRRRPILPSARRLV